MRFWTFMHSSWEGQKNQSKNNCPWGGTAWKVMSRRDGSTCLPRSMCLRMRTRGQRGWRWTDIEEEVWIGNRKNDVQGGIKWWLVVVNCEGQIYWAWNTPLIFSLSIHLSLSFSLSHTFTHATRMPMMLEESEHEAMQQFNCSGSLARQKKPPKCYSDGASAGFVSVTRITVLLNLNREQTDQIIISKLH